MKNKSFKLTEQRKDELINCTIDYLGGLHGDIADLAVSLRAPGALNPRLRPAGTFLLEPDAVMTEAYYLETGLAILYGFVAGELQVYYVWSEKSIVVLYEEFMEKLPVEDCYIKLVEDTELVSISNFCVDDIYRKHMVAHFLTHKVLNAKTKKRNKQIQILLMINKKKRYVRYRKGFPELKNAVSGRDRLGNELLCAFIGITESTLLEAKRMYGARC